MKKYAFIVEGWADHDRLVEAFPHPSFEIIVMHARINNRLRQAIHYVQQEGTTCIILTDPDESGDWLAKKLQNEYGFFRLSIDPLQGRKWLPHGRYNYGIQHCSIDYLQELLHPYVN